MRPALCSSYGGNEADGVLLETPAWALKASKTAVISLLLWMSGRHCSLIHVMDVFNVRKQAKQLCVGFFCCCCHCRPPQTCGSERVWCGARGWTLPDAFTSFTLYEERVLFEEIFFFYFLFQISNRKEWQRRLGFFGGPGVCVTSRLAERPVLNARWKPQRSWERRRRLRWQTMEW